MYQSFLRPLLLTSAISSISPSSYYRVYGATPTTTTTPLVAFTSSAAAAAAKSYSPSFARNNRTPNNNNNNNINNINNHHQHYYRKSTNAANRNTRTTRTMSTSSSSSSTPPSVPLPKLSTYANSYAAAHGLQIEKSSSSYQCAPISLLPNIFPSSSFQTATSLARHFSTLVDRIARDGEFLEEVLGGEGGVVSRDGYTRSLLEMHGRIYGEGGGDGGEWGKFARSADRFGILRSDYMLDRDSNNEDSSSSYGLKQVELNTIASSFAGLSANVAGLHSLLSTRFRSEITPWITAAAKRVMGEDDSVGAEGRGVPENPSLTRLPKAMEVAHSRYLRRFPGGEGGERVVLFVVQEGETNTVDQRMLEFALWKNHGVPVVRLSLTRGSTHLRFDGETGALFVLPPDGNHDNDDGSSSSSSPEDKWQEVSVVYFRAGYAPTDYPGGDNGVEWKARETIERSRATKCPNLGYHLAGTKKVQQALARPGVLERFFPGEEGDGEGDVVGMLRNAMTGLYSLGDDALPEDIRAVEDAVGGGCGRYVLKPQREGGGYNYYGERLAEKLREGTTTTTATKEGKSCLELGGDLAEFILMQRLFPPQQTSILLRGGVVEGTGESVSELGVFGTVVADWEGEVVHNEYAGYILRTKFSDVDEGGVASGFATLSSPYLW